MKKVVFVLGALLSASTLSAQTLNENGLYVDDEGELFSGIVSQTQNSVKSELSIKEGVLEGEANYYYASGKLMESGYLSKGQKDRKWTRYSENGSVLAIGFYNLGKKTGTWTVFDDKGNKRFEMNYSDGQKTGIWTNWDENGKQLTTIDYTKLN